MRIFELAISSFLLRDCWLWPGSDSSRSNWSIGWFDWWSDRHDFASTACT